MFNSQALRRNLIICPSNIKIKDFCKQHSIGCEKKLVVMGKCICNNLEKIIQNTKNKELPTHN